MSIAYVYENKFYYQDIPDNNIIIKQGASSFTDIAPTEGYLMYNGVNYYFGYPTAAEMISNYSDTNNLIIQTENNTLKQIPVYGDLSAKVIKVISNEYQLVDFTPENAISELYNSSSNQIFITSEGNWNVINIPTESISNNYWGVKYDNISDKFTVVNPDNYYIQEQFTRIKYSMSSTLDEIIADGSTKLTTTNKNILDVPYINTVFKYGTLESSGYYYTNITVILYVTNYDNIPNTVYINDISTDTQITSNGYSVQKIEVFNEWEYNVVNVRLSNETTSNVYVTNNSNTNLFCCYMIILRENLTKVN